jgi:hypothetical protein
MKRQRMQITGYGTQWRFTAASGERFDVAISVPLAGKQLDAARRGWMAQIDGRTLQPDPDVYWRSELEALDGVEASILTSHRVALA